MFAINGLAYRKVSDVPLGNLVLCGSYAGGGPELALRVEAPGDHAMDRQAVLFLRSHTQWNEVGAMVYGKSGDQLCLDLGVPTFAINDALVGAAIGKRSYDARIGMLALRDQDLMILAGFGNYGHHRAWWHVTSGKQASGEQRLLIERWCVGLFDVNRDFVPQLRFPDDFKCAMPTA